VSYFCLKKCRIFVKIEETGELIMGRSLRKIIEVKIRRSRKNVFLRKDFEDLGGYDQVGRALRELIKEKRIVKIGYGLYAKARINSISGEPMPAIVGGFRNLVREALDRLGINWLPTDMEKEYDKGGLQIPSGQALIIRDRFNRKISSGSLELKVIRA
jgi:hypothetical protein